MPSFRKRYRRRRPYYKRSPTYKKKRNYRRGLKRSSRRLRRTTLKSRAMTNKSYLWRPASAVQGFNPLTGAHPWGTYRIAPTLQMDALPDYNSLMNTWNYYKFCKAVFFFHVPGTRAMQVGTFNSVPPGGTVTAAFSGPILGSYIDPDGLNTVTSLQLLQEEPSAKFWRMLPGTRRKRVYRPAFLTPAYRVGATNGYRPSHGWLTQSYLNIPHYGIIFDYEQGLTGFIDHYCYWQIWILIGLKQLDFGRPFLMT